VNGITNAGVTKPDVDCLGKSSIQAYWKFLLVLWLISIFENKFNCSIYNYLIVLRKYFIYIKSATFLKII